MNFVFALSFLVGTLAYMSIFVLAVNILVLLFDFPKENEYCTEGNCKNKSFALSEFCYWHHPTRKAIAPIGSEVIPRRSLRVALKNQGMNIEFPPESKIH